MKNIMSKIPRLDKQFWKTYAVQIIFYAVLIILFLGWTKYLNQSSAKYLTSSTDLLDAAGTLKTFLVTLVSSSILLLALLAANWILTEYFAWNILLGKKFSSSALRKFTLLSLITIIITLGLNYLFFSFVLKNISTSLAGLLAFNKIGGYVIGTFIAVFALMPLTFYFINVHNNIYLQFYNENKVFKAIKEGLKAAFSPRFYMHHVTTGIIFSILLLVITIFAKLGTAYLAIFSLVLILLSAWLKASTKLIFIHQEYHKQAKVKHTGKKHRYS